MVNVFVSLIFFKVPCRFCPKTGLLRRIATASAASDRIMWASVGRRPAPVEARVALRDGLIHLGGDLRHFRSRFALESRARPGEATTGSSDGRIEAVPPLHRPTA